MGKKNKKKSDEPDAQTTDAPPSDDSPKSEASGQDEGKESKPDGNPGEGTSDADPKANKPKKKKKKKDEKEAKPEETPKENESSPNNENKDGIDKQEGKTSPTTEEGSDGKEEKGKKKNKKKKAKEEEPSEEKPEENVQKEEEAEKPKKKGKAAKKAEDTPEEKPEEKEDDQTQNDPESGKKKKKGGGKKKKAAEEDAEKKVDDKAEKENEPSAEQTKKKNSPDDTDNKPKTSEKKGNKKKNQQTPETADGIAEEKPKKNTKAKKNKTKSEPNEIMNSSAVISNEEEEIPMLSDENYQKFLDIAAMFSNIKRTAKKHNQIISGINQGLTKVEDTMDKLERINSKTQLLWRISDFKRRFVDARKGVNKVLYSPEIETHQYGYKLALSLCPNGDGKGAGSHMSLFFSILRGQYDDLLIWPFSCKLTFTLCDQTQGKRKSTNNIEGVFHPNPTPQNMPFLGQPTAFRNHSLGLPRFAPLVEVWADDSKYVVDDTIFIRVDIDLTELDP